MAHLFESLTQRGVRLRNRVVMSPMCEYSSEDGFANDWHLVHLVSRAVGGAGLILTEAAAVEARGRISPQDLGIWQDAHIEPLARIVDLIHKNGAVAGIQLAHAGRKASTAVPWEGGLGLSENQGGWQVIAPSAIAFNDQYLMPVEMTREDIKTVTDSFVQAMKRSLQAGFKIIEIHAAHGYLINEFLSPLSNQRSDQYGGSFENRIRLLCEITTAIRDGLPDSSPLWVRISATDWAEGGWRMEESVELAKKLRSLGADLIDCSSGGLVPGVRISAGPGYQTVFSDRIRREAGVATAAVGMITAPEQADHILRTEQADLVLLARELLRDPYWPLRAAQKLSQPIPTPVQYERAWQ